MLIIRKAQLEEAQMLSDLALLSKAYWDYPEEFILACRDALTINVAYIQNNHVFVLDEEKQIIGFFSFMNNGDEHCLDFLYINPEYIGNGYGKALWRYVKQKAEELNIASFTIDSDPYAKGFYEKMGAVQIGEAPSNVFKDRMLPLMKYEVR